MLRVKQGELTYLFPSRKAYREIRDRIYENVKEHAVFDSTPAVVVLNVRTGRFSYMTEESAKLICDEDIKQFFSVRQYCERKMGEYSYKIRHIPKRLWFANAFREALGGLAGNKSDVVVQYYKGESETGDGKSRRAENLNEEPGFRVKR